MTKMIKMDLYRFFRSVSTWIILFAIAALAFLSVVLVSMNTSIQSYSNAGELLAAQINGGTLMTLCAIAVIIFVSTKYKNGFIKNIANQLSRRELLVFPEIIVSSVACALYFLAYSICTIVAGAVIFGNTFITFSFAITTLRAAALLNAISRKTDWPFPVGAAKAKGLLPITTPPLLGTAMTGSPLLMESPIIFSLAARLA